MQNIFKGTKVIELAGVLAGPSVGMFFAELGARVIKIENKLTGGDVTRNWRLETESTKGPSAYFSSINYKKEHLFLDLTNAADHEQLVNELTDADMVISNFSKRVAQKLKVTYEDITAVNPQIIFLQLDGFKNSKRPAYDVVLQAETGWISMNGHPNHPAKMPVALIDILAAHQLKEGALIAMLQKSKTGMGAHITCNLEQASLAGLANQASNFLMNNHTPQPIGTLHPNIAPYGDWFTTKDNERIVLAVGSEKQFENLNLTLNLNLHTHPHFNTNARRLENREELQKLLESRIKEFAFTELEFLFDKKGVPFGKIKSVDQVLHSPAAKEMIRTDLQDGKLTKRLSEIAFDIKFKKQPEVVKTK